MIDSAVNNTGVLEAAGDLIVSAKVTGAGKLEINGGTLELTQANVASNVAFLTANGVLQIDHAQTYAGTVTGMSTTFGTTLDLSDIGFGGSTTATYSGTTASGVLTVSDGTHIAKIKLAGNYTASTFSVSSDGHGGTDVVDPKATTHAIAASPHAFIAAMASLGATSDGSGAHAVAADHKLQPVLATPVLQSA